MAWIGGCGRRDITPLRSHQVNCVCSPRVAGSVAANIPRLSCCPCWRPFSVGLRSRGSNEGEPPCSRPSVLPTLTLQLPQPEATGQRQQWYLLSALYFLMSKSKGRPGSTHPPPPPPPPTNRPLAISQLIFSIRRWEGLNERMQSKGLVQCSTQIETNSSYWPKRYLLSKSWDHSLQIAWLPGQHL